MRWWLKALVILAAILGVSFPALARDPHIIKVTETAFEPAALTVQKGDVVRWLWESGTHVVLSGAAPEDEKAGEIFSFPLNSEIKEFEFTFQGTGDYPFFSQGHPAMRGTVTVLEATPVQIRTWGFLKKLFETP